MSREVKCYRKVTLSLYTFLLDREIPEIPSPPGVEIACIGVGNLPAWDSVKGLRNRKQTSRRLKRGESVWVALREREVLSYCWMSDRVTQIGEIEKRILPADNEVYLYDAFTLSPHRGRKLFPSLLVAALEYLGSAGISRAIIGVLDENVASRNAIARAGFTLFQNLHSMRIFGYSFLVRGRILLSQRKVVVI